MQAEFISKVDKGFYLLEKGKVKEAEEVFRKVIAENIYNYLAYLGLSECFLIRSKQYKKEGDIKKWAYFLLESITNFRRGVELRIEESNYFNQCSWKTFL